MRAIAHTHELSRLDQTCFSYALRSSYLLSDTVIAIGAASTLMYFDDIVKKYSVRQKMDILKSVVAINQPEVIEVIDYYFESTKMMNKVKHQPTPIFVSYKKMEHTLLEIFNGWAETVTNAVCTLGYKELRTLIGEDFGYYHIDKRGEATPKNEYGLLTFENLMKLVLPDTDDLDYLFVFTGIFFDPAFLKQAIECPVNGRIITDMQPYLYNCLSLPNLNLLTSTELLTERNRLQPTTLLFNEKVDEWLKICYTGEDKNSGLHFFKSDIIPALEPLKEALYDSMILQHCSKVQNDEVRSYLYMGEIPTTMIWAYFKHYEMIDDELFNSLMSLLPQDDFLNRRWPVMIYHLQPNTEPTAFNLTKEDKISTELTAVRKSIAVD